MALTKDQILGADDLRRESVSVPEWGGDVWVGVMTGRQRDALESGQFRLQKSGDPMANMRARMAVYTVTNEDGSPMFTEADIPKLAGKSGVALGRIFTVATRLNGMSPEVVDELVGNSASAQSDGSGSTSPKS